MGVNLGKQKKEALIENFGQHIEAEDNLPPLAARMLATLIIDNHKGTTFEEMVDSLKASKSSVCTNLNILLHTGRITYFTLPGDRKRYFTVSPDDMIDRMDEKIRSCEQKLAICNQIIDYKKDHTEPGEEAGVSRQLNYLKSFIQFMEQYKELCHQHKENVIRLKK